MDDSDVTWSAGGLPRAQHSLPKPPSAWAALSDILLSRKDIVQRLQVAAPPCPQQAYRPSKVSFCGGRSKRPETRKRKHLPQGRWLLGSRFRLSSRKWASGARESGRWGAGTKQCTKSRLTRCACLHVSYLRRKKAPVVESGSHPMIISKCICMRGSSYLYT